MKHTLICPICFSTVTVEPRDGRFACPACHRMASLKRIGEQQKLNPSD